ncbi:MAG: type II toxin-antitoxin system RelE/ParE family toxin [Pseudomonadota bacterium]|jgi:toxin ParE1/3/4|nr:type II toxin-antitoxin system RelE/ParE family toxin [Pseudomonadota bacterium]MEC8104694.1 type II toxin-antitoxin system RelE/ParE family toxin [Pseudomonadota bacterium]MEC8523969.1 type II toxin-antitoxin system RelE/ParE family toxin [Pseudomonadota bacterium]MEC8907867.1 type II toxin-antitoxin system RelE/ParE family toxin [Pseudomonadota bacterium]MEC9255854.1 type II toxin-antitoxin system RelE/ParE family toxin [Pseudomonadota bacterium]|tara:strand:+ start:128 stop:430 length:303 start_codon:yes stop_codon:yes gene_type:complete
MTHYSLTNAAQADLHQLKVYSDERWGVRHTREYLMALRTSLQTLAENPGIGKHRPEVSASSYSFPFRSHVIYYLSAEAGITIFAVLHKRMVPEKHLRPEI